MYHFLRKSFLIGLFVFTGTVIGEDKLEIHGFIAQGLIQADGSNYVNEEGDVSPELTEVGLNFSYQISQNLRLAGQGVYLNGGNRYNEGARLDYLMLDWNVYQDENDKTNLYLGQIKTYTWLYSSVRDIPMARPSIILPQGIYFDATRDLSVGGLGAYINHNHSFEKYGNIDFNLSSSRSDIPEKQKKILLGDFAIGDLDHDFDGQAGIYWQPSDFSPWRFGVSFLTAQFNYDTVNGDVFSDGTLKLERRMANFIYEGEHWEFSAEFMEEDFEVQGLYFDGSFQERDSQAGYAQVRYKLSEDLMLLGRVERFYSNTDDRKGKELEESTGGLVPNYFAYQHSATIGLRYDIKHNLRVQLENHWMEGTARLTPIILPDPVSNDEEHWQVWAVQLMYWF